MVIPESTLEAAQKAGGEVQAALGQWSLAKHAGAVNAATSALSARLSSALPLTTPSQVGDVEAAISALHAYAPKAAAALAQEPLFAWHPPSPAQLLELAMEEGEEGEEGEEEGEEGEEGKGRRRRGRGRGRGRERAASMGTGSTKLLQKLFTLPAMLERIVLAPLMETIREGMEKSGEVGQFSRRVEALAPYLQPHHLDLREVGERGRENLEEAGEMLKAMDRYPLPHDKIVLLLNACNLVFAALQGEEGGADTLSADDFLPCFIYTVVSARALNLPLHLQILHFFLHPDEASSAPGYFVMQACSVVSFVSTLKASSLSLLPGQEEHPLELRAFFEQFPPLPPSRVLPWMSGLTGPSTPPPPSSSSNASGTGVDGEEEGGGEGGRVRDAGMREDADVLRAVLDKERADWERRLARVKSKAAGEVAEVVEERRKVEVQLEALKAQMIAGDPSGVMRTNLVLRERVEELEGQVASLTEGRAIDADLLAELRGRCDMFCEQMALFQEEAEAAKVERESAKGVAVAAAENMEELNAALAQARGKAGALQEALNKTNGELEALVLEHHELQALHKASSQSAAVSDTLSARVVELEAAVAAAQSELESAVRDRDEAMSELARTSRTLVSVQESFGKTRQAHSEKVVALELAKAAVEEELAEVKRRGVAAVGDVVVAGEEGKEVEEDGGESGAGWEVERERLEAQFNYRVQSLKLTIAEAQAETRAAVEEAESAARQEKKEKALNRMLQSELKDALARAGETEGKLERKLRNAQEAGKASLRERNAMAEELEKEKAKVAELSLSVSLLVTEVSELETVLQEKEYAELNKEAWVPDADMSSCNLCDVGFSLFKRKHHCRLCGHIYCAECSGNRVALPSSPHPVRACNTCFAVRKSAALRQRQRGGRNRTASSSSAVSSAAAAAAAAGLSRLSLSPIPFE